MRFWAVYSISKKAVSLLQALKDLKEGRPSSGTLVAPIPPPPILEIPTSSNGIDLTPYLTKIKDYLEDEKVGIVGIWGMGGVGKSTLLEEINNNLFQNSDNMFDHVVKVVVSKEFAVEKVQSKIAEILKLTLSVEMDS